MEQVHHADFCPQCGEDLRNYPVAKFCRKCGRKLVEDKIAVPVKKIPFQFDDASYHDKRYDFPILLDGSGSFTMGLSLTQSEYDKRTQDGQQLPEVTDEMVPELRKDFENAFRTVVSGLQGTSVPYDMIPFTTDKFLESLSTAMDLKWKVQGLVPIGVEFHSLYPDEKSTLAIAKFNREHRTADDGGSAGESKEQRYIRENFTKKEKIAAIDWYKKAVGCGFAEAKQVVDQILQ